MQVQPFVVVQLCILAALVHQLLAICHNRSSTRKHTCHLLLCEDRVEGDVYFVPAALMFTVLGTLEHIPGTSVELRSPCHERKSGDA